jgi:hypothetical protein
MALNGGRALMGMSGSMWGQQPLAVARAAQAEKGVDLAVTERARRERRHALILPREHGAWGLLLVPLVTGAGVAFRESNHVVPVFLLLAATLALFWLRTPVESLLGTSAMRAQTTDERRVVAIVSAGLAAVATLALGTLLWAGRNPDLWLMGATAAAAFNAQALLKKLGRRARMLAEIVGTIGLTTCAPAAYYVITGRFGVTAWMLWLANLIFAGNQIHYVQVRIHTARFEGRRAKFARGWAFAVGQVLMSAVLCVACLCGLMPWLALVAFVPILFRGWFYFFQKSEPLMVRRLGWSELGQGITFCALFIAAFALRR